MWKWYLIAVALIMLGYSVVCYLGFLRKSKIEYVYLAVALTFGMIFILCFPHIQLLTRKSISQQLMRM